jgi:hypothetical protein
MDLKRHIVERLRLEKVEAAYPQWMEGLRVRYGVEINWELWEQSQHPGSRIHRPGKGIVALKQKFSLGVLIGVWMLCTATATAAASEVLDRIVAVVNEDIILLSELNERMAPYAQRIRQQGFDLDKERQMLFKVRKEMLNRLVDEKLTDQEIKRNDIQVDEAEIDSTIERIKAANSFTDEDLRRFLKQDQMTMEQYREQIKEQVLRTRLVNYQVKSKIVITEEEIRAYYDSHPALYGGKQSLSFEKHPDAGSEYGYRCRETDRKGADATDSIPGKSRGILCRPGPKV